MINKAIVQINEHKLDCIKKQDFQGAAAWRDLEKSLMLIGSNTNELKKFIEFFKKDTNRYNYIEMYDIIKPLDIITQRKEKIQKIEKLK